MRKKRILILLALGAAAAGVLGGFYFLAQKGIGLGCPLYQLTGLQCPGCGNSRAVLALLRLDIGSALQYNLLFPLEAGYLLWVLFRLCKSYLSSGRFSYLPKRSWMDLAVLVLIAAWGILRNIL